MPSFDAGQSGLTGTVGVTILTAAGAVHTARATAGITEPVAGSGVYFLAHPDPGTLLLFVFDGGVGTVGASVWDDGVQLAPKSTALSNAVWTDTKAGYIDAAVSAAKTLTSAYDASKEAASAASVAAIPTTPLLAASYTAPDNASIAAILEDTGTTIPETLSALATEANATSNRGTLLTAISGAVLGTDRCTLTIEDGTGAVIPDARVYVSSDTAGVTRSDTRVSDSIGQVVFDLTSGETYYIWRTHNEYVFSNPQTFIAVAD